MSYTHCAICGRLLTDPVSVQRGIGPVCWKKFFSKNRTIDSFINTDEYIPPASADLTQFIKYFQKNKTVCVWCFKPLNIQNLRMWDHEGGIKVKGLEKKQWVFCNCSNPQCKYQNSLYKVHELVKVRREHPEIYNRIKTT